MTRALVHLPRSVRRGEPFEVRSTLAHAMETGYRRDSDGRLLPRDIVRRFEARLDNELVFAADLHPAVAANPFIAFWMAAERSGTLELRWTGDRGFDHRERADVAVAAA